MNKVIGIILAMVMVITTSALSLPVLAKTQPGETRAVFEADIFDIRGGDPLNKGEVYIRTDGSVKVEIEGAAANERYRVVLICGKCGDTAATVLGMIYTDNNGDFLLTSTLQPKVYVSPRVSVDKGLGTQAEFVSGFRVPQEP